MGRGIDYGHGTTNLDKSTGIRYGVIPVNDVLQAWCDSSESDYGPPRCPECGQEAVQFDEDEHDGYASRRSGEREYVCESCEKAFGPDEAYGDTPLSNNLDDGEYAASQNGESPDIFIVKSPYYTRAAFCSPCAPGACYLTSPCDDGEKAYCFGHDWFDGGKAPYRVFRVSDDTEVLPD